LEQLETALDHVLDAAVSTPPDEAALARTKTRLKAEAIYAQDGLFPLANLIASLYAIGLDEQVFYDWPTRIEAVSGTQAQEAARAVLAPNRRVTGYLVPKAVADVPVTPPAETEAPHAP
jgi:zinc protease